MRWYEQIELGIPFTEVWNVRGQVAVLNHQRQVRCNYYNGQQGQSSTGGALTLRDLWDDWEIMLFQAQLIGCYVTCITRKKSVGKQKADVTHQNGKLQVFLDPDISHCLDPISIDWREWWVPLRKDTVISLLEYKISIPVVFTQRDPWPFPVYWRREIIHTFWWLIGYRIQDDTSNRESRMLP